MYDFNFSSNCLKSFGHVQLVNSGFFIISLRSALSAFSHILKTGTVVGSMIFGKRNFRSLISRLLPLLVDNVPGLKFIKRRYLKTRYN